MGIFFRNGRLDVVLYYFIDDVLSVSQRRVAVVTPTREVVKIVARIDGVVDEVQQKSGGTGTFFC